MIGIAPRPAGPQPRDGLRRAPRASRLRRLPAEILAIDWGSTPAKRQICRAVLRRGRYVLAPPRPLEDVGALELPDGALIAFDCPIGVAREYAATAGLRSFRAALGLFGTGRFGRFYEIAAQADDITTERPFYPLRGVRGTSRDDLRKALGVAAFAPRACDRQAGAGPIFWLVGPRQVGRSAACIWRDIIAPHLGRVALWPFDGPLTALVASGRPVVAEMYPAYLLRTLGVTVARKSDPAARAACGRALLRRVGTDVRLDLDAVRRLLRGGFGPSRSGEDPFDATIACIALAKLLLDGAMPEAPDHARAVEGWILGLPSEGASTARPASD
ncbi:MAG: hypothetical protein DMD96_18715 [Candidatus Rokuibacteriota bacterium]|nr:MAG: hypothetical protein DMD96_18715 [Candidatus Rokubacteria bacterium]